MNNPSKQPAPTGQPTPPNADNHKEAETETTTDEGLTFWQMLGSVMAAAFGVQSKKNRERDFSQGKPIHFIILGIGFTAAFVLIMTFIVRLILSNVS